MKRCRLTRTAASTPCITSLVLLWRRLSSFLRQSPHVAATAVPTAQAPSPERHQPPAERRRVSQTLSGCTGKWDFSPRVVRHHLSGSVSFLAGKVADSTVFLLTVSVPTRALTFVRENDRYRASYSATLSLTRASEAARRFETHHIVRVASFRETTRSDESVLYQQLVLARPGSYELSFLPSRRCWWQRKLYRSHRECSTSDDRLTVLAHSSL